MLAITVSACGSSGTDSTSSTGNDINNAAQTKDDTQLAYVEPLPYFPFSQIKQNLIDIEAINALGINSTTFFFIQGIDHPIYQCASIGVPVPATDQLSNPVTAQWSNNTYNNEGIAGVTVGQAEPEGVFTGDTTGTYSLCTDPAAAAAQLEGYDEGLTVSLTAPAYWDTKAEDGLPAGHIHLNGAPVFPVCVVKVLVKNKKAEELCTLPPKHKAA